MTPRDQRPVHPIFSFLLSISIYYSIFYSSLSIAFYYSSSILYYIVIYYLDKRKGAEAPILVLQSFLDHEVNLEERKLSVEADM